jgi:hypothetical protein
VDLTTFSNCGHRSIDQPQIEILEFGIELKSASYVGREGRIAATSGSESCSSKCRINSARLAGEPI